MASYNLYHLSVFKKKNRKKVFSSRLPGEYLFGMGKQFPKKLFTRKLRKIS
jgi:hypothetical protein